MSSQDSRNLPRPGAHIHCTVKTATGSFAGLLRDLNARGCKIELDDHRVLSGAVQIYIPSSNTTLKATGRWKRGDAFGVEFDAGIVVEPILLQCTELREHLKNGPDTVRRPSRARIAARG